MWCAQVPMAWRSRAGRTDRPCQTASLLDADLRESLPGWRRLGPLTPGGPVLTFQPVTEPRLTKVRIHLDLQVDDLPSALALVGRLGGHALDQVHEYAEGTVVVVADVEDNEFCGLWRRDGSAA